MGFEQREGSGSLFKNDKKTAENQPNATGSALIGGVEYWVSGWTKTDKNGGKWQSLAFKRKDEAERKPAPARSGSVAELDSDLPF